MDPADAITQSERLEARPALRLLEDALEILGPPEPAVVSTWGRLTLKRAWRLMQLGRVREAVDVAGRLVDVMTSCEPPVDAWLVGEAMIALARAFERDKDFASAESVMRAMAGRFSPGETPGEALLRVRGETLVGRYLRLRDLDDEAIGVLRSVLDISRAMTGKEIRASEKRAECELVLALLAQEHLGEAIEVGNGFLGPLPGLSNDLRGFAVRATDRLGNACDRAGKREDAVRFYRVAMELLETDSSTDARRDRAAIGVAMALDFAALSRNVELVDLGESWFRTYGRDPDGETLEQGIFVGAMGALAAIRLEQPVRAREQSRELLAAIPIDSREGPFLRAKLNYGVVLAVKQQDGPEAVEQTCRNAISGLTDLSDPRVAVFAAWLWEEHAIALLELHRETEAISTARLLERLLPDFPSDNVDFTQVIDAGVRAGGHLLGA